MAEGGAGGGRGEGGLRLLTVRQTVCHQVQPEGAPPRAYRGAALQLPYVWEELQAEGAHAEALLRPPAQGPRGGRGRSLKVILPI